MATGNLGGKVTVPWTADQVASLNAYQRSGVFHEYTCPNMHPVRCPDRQCRDSTWDHECQEGTESHGVLVATPSGWHCPKGCGFTQDWAHDRTADWSWGSGLICGACHQPYRDRDAEMTVTVPNGTARICATCRLLPFEMVWRMLTRQSEPR
jgi:hypothetical protein